MLAPIRQRHSVCVRDVADVDIDVAVDQFVTMLLALVTETCRRRGRAWEPDRASLNTSLPSFARIPPRVP